MSSKYKKTRTNPGRPSICKSKKVILPPLPPPPPAGLLYCYVDMWIAPPTRVQVWMPITCPTVHGTYTGEDDATYDRVRVTFDYLADDTIENARADHIQAGAIVGSLYFPSDAFTQYGPPTGHEYSSADFDATSGYLSLSGEPIPP